MLEGSSAPLYVHTFLQVIWLLNSNVADSSLYTFCTLPIPYFIWVLLMVWQQLWWGRSSRQKVEQPTHLILPEAVLALKQKVLHSRDPSVLRKHGWLVTLTSDKNDVWVFSMDFIHLMTTQPKIQKDELVFHFSVGKKAKTISTP